jgi:putative ABC transport system substrate-binding protein
MDRRRFLLTSLAGALAAPLAAGAVSRTAEAQSPGKVSRIGLLGNARLTEVVSNAFSTGLRDRGWVEGQNFVWERRFSEGRNERFPGLAADLVQAKPDVIIAAGTAAAVAAKAATTTIPIVFYAVADPVGSGLVASLARPAGNATGLGGLGPRLHCEDAGASEGGRSAGNSDRCPRKPRLHGAHGLSPRGRTRGADAEHHAAAGRSTGP